MRSISFPAMPRAVVRFGNEGTVTLTDGSTIPQASFDKTMRAILILNREAPLGAHFYQTPLGALAVMASDDNFTPSPANLERLKKPDLGVLDQHGYLTDKDAIRVVRLAVKNPIVSPLPQVKLSELRKRLLPS